MLTDEEWAEVSPLLHSNAEKVKSYREEHGVGLREAMDAVRGEACEKFFEITGFRETNPQCHLAPLFIALRTGMPTLRPSIANTGSFILC